MFRFSGACILLTPLPAPEIETQRNRCWEAKTKKTLEPEKRGRKPGSSLNGDRRVESMGGIVAGGWWGHRGRGGGAGMVRLCWVWSWGALGEKEGMCRKKERREEVWER